MKIQRIYRVLLALVVVIFSTASAVHGIAHASVIASDGHEYTHAVEHGELHHAESCLFCAKGPTVSLEAETLVFSFITHAEYFRSTEVVTRAISTCDLLASLRAPPAA